MTATAPTAAEPATFPLRRVDPFSTPSLYEHLRSNQPVSRVQMVGGNTAWLVTRHEDVRRVLTDPRMSADRRHPGFPRFAAATEDERQASFRNFRPPLNWMDPPEHTVVRRSVLAEFSTARMEALRPRVEAVVEACLDRMATRRRPVDLVPALSLPVPSLVMCELLGVPYDRHDAFEERTTRMLSRSTPARERAACAHAIREFLDGVVRAKEASPPADDLLGRLLAAGELDHEAVVSMAFVLLVAGHATTANMISLGTLALLQHPDQLARIVADPSRTPAAVEELLRYCSIVEAATSRTALADVEIGGVTIRAGEGVVALGQTANHDPEVFADPDRLDVDRDARRHVAFGVGRHTCLGRDLARMELQIAFDGLFGRFPGLRLAVPAADLAVKDDANVYGLYELPVTW